MLLAIDVGNTNTEFAIFDKGGAIKGSWRMRSDALRTADEYAAFLMPLFAAMKLSFKDASDVIIASVVPDARFNLVTLCKQYMGKDPLFIDSQMIMDAGLGIVIDKPQEAGADRLVNALAVRQKYGSPAILVDFGTATNFDVLNEDGAFAGGVIAPGINLSCDALYRASAKLPRIDIHAPQKAIGTNTIDAMRSGIFWGYVALIDGLLMRCKNEMKGTPKVIATGGLAPVFIDHLNGIDAIDQDITTYGLYVLHDIINT